MSSDPPSGEERTPPEEIGGEGPAEPPENQVRRRPWSPAYLAGESNVRAIGGEHTVQPEGSDETYRLAGDDPPIYVPIQPRTKATGASRLGRAPMVLDSPGDNPPDSSRAERRPPGGWREFRARIGCRSVVFVIGLCATVFAVTAIRLVADDVGQSVRVWTTVGGVVLAGFALGSLLGGLLADRISSTRLVPWLLFTASVACVSTLVLDEVVRTWDRGSLDWSTWTLVLAATLFAAPSLALGTVPPAVATRALRVGRGNGASVGSLQAWGALGAVVGLVLVGHVLLDAFGSRPLVWLTAAVLAITGILSAAGMWAFRAAVGLGWLQFLVLLGLAATATPAVLSRLGNIAAATEPREHTSPESNSLARVGGDLRRLGLTLGLRSDGSENEVRYESAYSTVRIVDSDDRRERVLLVDGLARSRWSADAPTTPSTEVERLIARITMGIAHERDWADPPILLLGAGRAVLPGWMAAEFPASPRIDVVEVDPAVMRALAEERGPRPAAGPVHAIVRDPALFLADREESEGFELVVNTLRPEAAWHTWTCEFHERIARHLDERGVYLLEIPETLPRVEFPAEPGETYDGRIPVALAGEVGPPGEWSRCDAPFEGLEIQNRGTLEQPAYVFAVRGAVPDELREALLASSEGHPLFREFVDSFDDHRPGSEGRFLARSAVTLADVLPHVAVIEVGDGTSLLVAAHRSLPAQVLDGASVLATFETTADGQTSARGLWSQIEALADGRLLVIDQPPMLPLTFREP